RPRRRTLPRARAACRPFPPGLSRARLEPGRRFRARRSRADVLGDERLSLWPGGGEDLAGHTLDGGRGAAELDAVGDDCPEGCDVSFVRPPDRPGVHPGVTLELHVRMPG